jgi:hypothetical protein
MIPTDRASLKTFVLRKLGAPVITINVDPDQVDDRIDEAVLLFQTYHYDGKQQVYTSINVTSNMVNTKSVVMPANTIGVTRIFTLGGSSTSSDGTSFNMFDINYQIRLNELYDYTAGDYTYFELANEHLRMLEMLFTGELPIRYNRYNNTLFIDAQWKGKINPGSFIIAECYAVLDNTATFWGDPWLIKYTTALVKQQWGENLKKFGATTLPGGMVLNGQQIWNEADLEREKLEKKLRDEFEDPPEFIFG